MNTPITNNLRQLRQKTGLRQIDVAQAVGLESSDRISHWEAGNKFPSVINLFKLARLYGVTPDALYPELYSSLAGSVTHRELPLPGAAGALAKPVPTLGVE